MIQSFFEVQVLSRSSQADMSADSVEPRGQELSENKKWLGQSAGLHGQLGQQMVRI